MGEFSSLSNSIKVQVSDFVVSLLRGQILLVKVDVKSAVIANLQIAAKFPHVKGVWRPATLTLQHVITSVK